MDREGAETQLRLLAEAELRHATTRPADGGLLDECHSARLELVAQALHAAHAFDNGRRERDPGRARAGPGRAAASPRTDRTGAYAQANLAWLMHSVRYSTAPRRWPAPHASWRVVPVGQVIRTRAGDVQGELHLLTYLQTATARSARRAPRYGAAAEVRAARSPSPVAS